MTNDHVPCIRRRSVTPKRVLWVLYCAGLTAFYVFPVFGALAAATAPTTVELIGFSRRGIAVLGIVGASSVLFGARIGGRGATISFRYADVYQLLLSPVDHQRVMRRKLTRRVATGLAAGIVLGGAAGLGVGLYLEQGTLWHWVVSGSVYVATLCATYVGTAGLWSGMRWSPRSATIVGLIAVAWATFEFVGWRSLGSFADFARLFLFPLIGHAGGMLWPLIAAAAAVVMALRVIPRINLELVAHRAGLLPQLRFAAANNDLHSSVSLYARLSGEYPKSRPWARVRQGSRPVWTRSWRSVARFPTGRICRIVLGIVAEAAILRFAWGLSPIVVAVLLSVTAFIVAVELNSPLASELDHHERAFSFPLDEGDLTIRLLIVPFVLLVLLQIAVFVIGSVGQAALQSLPLMLVAAPIAAGAAIAGSAVALRRSPGGLVRTSDLAGPPEAALISAMLRFALPLLLVVVGFAPIAVLTTNPQAAMSAGILVASALISVVCPAVYLRLSGHDVGSAIRRLASELNILHADNRAPNNA